MENDRLRLASFNVCGIKNIVKFKEWADQKSPLQYLFEEVLKADIICIQETRIQSDQLTRDLAFVPGYDAFYSFPTSKKGYSGVAIYARSGLPVQAAFEGLLGWPSEYGGTLAGDESLDSEGRCLVLDVKWAVLIGLYCPANSLGTQDEYRQDFFQILDIRVRQLLTAGRQVVVFGDINVAPQVIDNADGTKDFIIETGHALISEKDAQTLMRANLKLTEKWQTGSFVRTLVNSWLGRTAPPGTTEELVAGRENATDTHATDATGAGSGCHTILTDALRHLFPHRVDMYTCWNTYLSGRKGNYGSRVDLFLVSSGVEFVGGDIMPHVLGSDHCPIYLEVTCRDATAQGVPTTALGEICVSNLARFQSKSILSYVKRSETRSESPLDHIQQGCTEFRVAKKPGQQKISAFFRQEKRQPVPQINHAETAGVMQEMCIEGVERCESENEVEHPGNADKTEQKSRWAQVFSLKKIPKCKHGEDCIQFQTKKKGVNQGRFFWVCARPMGHNDPTLPGPGNFRCDYFKWA